MAESQLMGMGTAFIGFAILLSMGIVILSTSTGNCTTISGYNSTTPASSTGWGGACYTLNNNTISGYGLMGIAMVVIGAVAIITIIKYL